MKDYENLAPVYTEYNVGNYVRRFTLSNDVDSDRIQARMKNGVLELELPKAGAREAAQDPGQRRLTSPSATDA